jgi:hypothetical protein
MNAPQLTSLRRDSVTPGRRAGCLVVDIGLNCPSCRVALSLPSAYLGQVVTGPCPACGWDLVFCHGRIDSGAAGALEGVVEVKDGETLLAAPARTKLPKTGTLEMQYLESGNDGGAGEGSWGVAGGAEATDLLGGIDVEKKAGRWHRWGWGIGGVVVVGMAGVLWHLSRPAPAPPSPRPSAPSFGGRGPRALQAGWGEAALASWLSFSQAPDADARRLHVLDAERVGPAMKAWEEARPGADAAMAGREFRPLAGTPEDRRRGLVALGAVPRAAEERPMILFFRDVSAIGGGNDAAAPRFLLDWETYIQERDGLVEAFLADPSASRRTFRLAVEKVHFFGDNASASAGEPDPLGLKLRTPSGRLLPQVAEIRPGTPLHTRFSEQLPWGKPAYATLQLAWESEGASPRLVVTDLVCWHFPGLGGTPEIETELSPLPPRQQAQP